MAPLFFNLLVNSAFSLACGLVIVGFAVWLFRVKTGGWKLFLFSLPFVKIVFDLFAGLPRNSVLLHGIDPFSLPKFHQLLEVGFGVGSFGPSLSLIFSVKGLDGQRYAASVGDYLTIWLNRTFGADALNGVVFAILSISILLMVRRIFLAFKFEKERRRDRVSASDIKRIRLGWRRVDIYSSSKFTGTPFTGGILRPYICIPQKALEKLNSSELEAVMAHELAHIHHFDLPMTIAVQVLGDLFWFVPGYRWLSRKVDRLREIVADEWAVKRGAQPAHLASALVKLKEIPETPSKFILYSAFFREKSLLKTRVQRLLGENPEKESRFGWNVKAVRLVIVIGVIMTVMLATLGGNQTNREIKNPDWFLELMKKAGFEVLTLKK
ncbi:hypothetical protein AZI86_09215 [Bdellovibrio bacteriovorus]|uniref:Peptidase M56 domain-containing protein n=1 Tax=Bdellovibrio bacteriovorus TaxID=959 RepID=A0A150WS32_BDEBC|nr:M56 family metallopeptidase [Bdellovibrio bacteriovorus]KYG67178.1 hypothetical protein AZI86_09215 [Bdellovibrio bacteriovorus]